MIGDTEEMLLNDEWKTGAKCEISGNYCCKLHVSVEVFVVKGELFPKCKKGGGHNATFNLLTPGSRKSSKG